MDTNWQKLLPAFRLNDGSLPEIQLLNLSGEEVIYGYNFIRVRSARISSTGHYFWSKVEACEISFSINENPATLVVSGMAEPFHVCFDGTRSLSDKTIPELGVFVFPDSLALDYRPDDKWDMVTLKAFFEIISTLSKNFNSMQISHQENNYDDKGKLFKACWEEYHS